MLHYQAKGATNLVTSLADSGPGSLRETLATSAPGDTIQFAVEGTILLTGASGPLIIDKNIRILGPGQDKLTIDAQKQTYVFLVLSKVTATIADLSLTGGYNFVFSAEGSGGAVRNLGNLTMVRCLVTDSTSEFAVGGGIFNGGNLTLRDCSIIDNFAPFGGGIGDTGEGRLVIDSSTLFFNFATAPDGAGGGGIYKTGGLGMLTNVTVSGNRVLEGNGGGIAVSTYMLLESCTIVSNTATAFDSVVVIDGKGGGLAVSGPAGRVELRNTIIAGNVAENFIRANPPLSIGPDVLGFLFSQGWNLIQDTTDTVIAGVLTGNIHGQDPMLGPLQDNGGFTLTHALLPGSPAIDKASPNDFPRTDQRGVARPQDGDGDTKFRADIGSFEKETVIPGSIPGDFVVTSLGDDFSPGTLRRALNDAPPGSRITFAVEGTLVLTNGNLLVQKNVQIAGPGADKLTIEPRSSQLIFLANRAFLVSSNVTASIFDLTVANGQTAPSPGPDVVGGGVLNHGNLTMTRCVVTNCSAEFGPGGGIGSSGPLTLRQCIISDNVAASSGGGVAAFGPLIADGCTVSGNRALDPLNSDGGGISAGPGNTLLTNCTISGNLVFAGNGGGIASTGYLLLESCTIVSNTASGFANRPNDPSPTGRGGGVFVVAPGTFSRVKGTFESRNTIFAGNSASTFDLGEIKSIGPDCFGVMFSQGWNLIQDPSDCVIASVLTGNQLGVDPVLGPLQDNGGPTPTHALLPGSPAIDAGSPFDFPRTDQRGLARPQDGDNNGAARSDIGAFEKETPVP